MCLIHITSFYLHFQLISKSVTVISGVAIAYAGWHLQVPPTCQTEDKKSIRRNADNLEPCSV